MDVESTVILTQNDPDGGGPWALRVRHKRSLKDPRPAIRAAALEFLRTPAGRAVADENGGHFNYGDAALHIPAGILARHGILELEISNEAYTDDHDHDFAAEQ